MRRVTRSVRLRRPSRRIVVAGLLGALAATAFAVTLQTARDRGWPEIAAGMGFRVDQVLLYGRERAERGAVAAAIGAHRGMPLFAVDPGHVRDELRKVTWVSEAVVERSWPATLRVRLVEREPLAVWQTESGRVVVDRAGETIAGVDAVHFAHLPVLVGAEAPHRAGDLFAMLRAERDLAGRVTAAALINQRRWDVRLDNRVVVMLPELDARAAWSRLAAIERDERILARDLAAIDLRLPDRLSVQLGPEARERQRLGVERRPDGRVAAARNRT